MESPLENACPSGSNAWGNLSEEYVRAIARQERPRSLRKCRYLQGLGGLLLASSWFMPAVGGCGGPYIPAAMTWDAITGPTHATIEDLIPWFLLCVAPYLFGLLSFIAVLRNRSHQPEVGRKSGLATALLLGVVTFILAVTILVGAAYKDWPDPTFAVVVFLSAAFWIRAIRGGVGGLLSMQWYAGVCCVMWFVALGFDDDPLWGLLVSLAGALFITLGKFREAMIRSRLGAWRTVLGLLRGRLHLYDLSGFNCRSCGYLLIGLPSNRCPECGLQFDPVDYGLVPAGLDTE